MKTLSVLVAVACAAAGFTGCSSDDPKPAAEASVEPLEPTFANVYRQVVLVGGGACATTQCHGAAQGGGLRLDNPNLAVVHAELLGVPSEGLCIDGGAADGGTGFESCGCASTGKIRVVPNSPEESLFFEKLTQESPECGERMPPTGEPMSAAKIELVREWILKGAPND